MNTPCPSYRIHDYDFLDDGIAADREETRCSTIGRSRVICPVEIHVDASFDNAQGSSSAFDGSQRNLLNLDSDDENILNSPYIFIGDSHSSDNTPEKISYPDANSHSNYNLLTEDTQSLDSWSKRTHRSYSSMANKHCNTFPDSNSRRKYEVFSDNNSFDRNIEGNSYSPPRSVANSHETYRILSESYSDSRTAAENENLSIENLIPRDDSNYEIANSHSNYQIFYNSQAQIENRRDLINEMGEENHPRVRNLNFSSPTRSDSSRSSRSTEETSTTCDIEECLVQIEESLLNIEQNLLHVQDLDIPELKNLLYKSPSIERSLFEVQDLLCTENIESVKRGQLFSFSFDDDGENLIDISSKELSPDSDHDTFTNDDNLLQFNDEKPALDTEENVSQDLNSIFYGSGDKNVNFIPNSLSRTPTKGNFKGAGENIQGYPTEEENFSNDLINDNLNNKMDEKKLLDHKKCHSRTNSLDENSMFQNKEIGGKRKSSSESLRFEGDNKRDNCLDVNGKAKSDDTLDNKSLYDVDKRSKTSRRSRRRSKDHRLAEVEAKTDEFRRKIESIISSRQSIIPNLDNPTKNNSRQISTEASEMRRNSQERSPRMKKILPEKESPGNGKQLKSNSFEKRKRKKASRIQSGENAALVPSKLISLSLSLLLAALLQAVRCLTDLVDDAFRSVSYDRSGLLE